MITGNHKINIRTIRNLRDGEGLTLRGRRPVSYKTGWQVATHGVECTTPEEVAKLIRTAEYAEACGIWFSGGIYYVDHCIRIPTSAPPSNWAVSTISCPSSAGVASPTTPWCGCKKLGTKVPFFFGEYLDVLRLNNEQNKVDFF